MDKIIKQAFLNAILTAVYIILIVSLIHFIGESSLAQEPDTILAPIAMLMLFVFSAALTGSLVVGKPIFWFIEGRKKEALKLLTYTLMIFFLIMLIVFVLILTRVF